MILRDPIKRICFLLMAIVVLLALHVVADILLR